MRAHELLESFVTTLIPDYGKRQPFDVFRNPTSKEWREIKASNDDIRAFVVGDDLFAWSTYGDLHNNVRTALGLGPDAISVVIFGSPRGDAEIMVSDATRNTPWWHNPDTRSAIMGCDYLARTFTDLEISYYDEAIVGPWDEFEESMLTEGRTMKVDVLTQWHERKDVTLFVNPSAAQLYNLLKFQPGDPPRSMPDNSLAMRGIIDGTSWGKVYVWNGALHIDVAKTLQIPGGDSSDENRVFKVFVNWRDGHPMVAVHASQIDHPWVKRLQKQGMPIVTFTR